MADSNQQAIKKLNWTLLAKELKKFGIDIESEVREIIQSGNVRKIEEIFAFIVSFEKGKGCIALPSIMLACQGGPLPLISISAMQR
jgi:hypothetical protein